MTATPLRPEDPARLGDFAIEGVLGEGGQGIVYLGRSGDGTPVAVKVLRHAADPEARVRLARELAAIQKVAPFCTARVIEAGVEAAQPYIVSEFVDGPSLQDRVAEQGPLRDGELDRLAIGTASALAAIHGAGVVHRDFKPHNVLLGPDGPRVVDFGIARAGDAPTITQGVIGTPGYVSPEQLHGLPATPASDVFTWAATMVYAATGRSPFGGDSVAAILGGVMHSHPRLDDVPPPLRDVLAVCLAKDAAQRPSSRDVMTRLVDPSPGPTSPDGHQAAPVGLLPPPAGARPRRRGVWAAIAAAVVASALGAGITIMFLQSGSAQPPVTPTESAGNPLESIFPTGGSTPDAAEPPIEGITVPAEFAGTWAGKLEGSTISGGAGDQNVKLTLPEGEEKGTWESPGETPGCDKATVTPTGRDGSTLTLAVHEFAGSTCAAAKMRLDGTLRLTGERGRFEASLGNDVLPDIGNLSGDLNRS